MTLGIVNSLNFFIAYLILGVIRVIWILDRITASVTRISLILFMFSYCMFVFTLWRSGIFVYLPNVIYDSNIPPKNQVIGVLGAKSETSDKPFLKNEIELPNVTAKSYLVVERNKSKILLEKNQDEKLASASTTKLMTALVAFDVYNDEDTVKISKECAEIDSTKAGLPEGTEYKAYDLISAMLIGSAGDAACALSEGKIAPDEFLFNMNQKAYTFGMKNTYFTNALGLDGIDYSHFSTARDLYKLALFAVRNDKIADIVKTKDYNIKSIDKKFIGVIENTNKLLREIPQSVGIKTGTTVEAKEVLIYEFADETKDLIIIVMGSDDRFSDTRALLGWSQAAYEF